MIIKKLLWFCGVGVGVVFLLLAGCKIEISVPKGGDITTVSGSYGCVSGQRCTIDVSDVYFDENFVAAPDTGYIFLGWKPKNKSFCGGSNKPCRLTTTAFSEFDWLMALLESDEVFYLEPVFVKGTPIAEAISRIPDDVFRECVKSWAKNATYAEEVTDIRCIEYTADIESIEGIQSFLGLKTLMLNAWKYDLVPLSAIGYLEYLRLYVHPDADLLPLQNLAQLQHLDLGIFQEESMCNKYANTQWRCTGKGFENFDALANLIQLNFLNLYFNNPDLKVVGKLGNLKTLISNSNNVTDISPLGNLSKLTRLDLQNNRIIDVSTLKNTKRLERLNVSGNQIHDISALVNLRNLDQVYLSSNKLVDISALRGKKLSSLSLSGNQISDIGPLAELKHPGVPPNNRLTLDLRNNRINVINGALDSIERGDIYFEGNPLLCSEIEKYEATKPAHVEVHSSNCVEG